MNQQEFFTLIEEIERQFPVEQWTAYGIPVWPIARIASRTETLGVTNPEALDPASNLVTKLIRKAIAIITYIGAPLIDPARNCRDFRHELLRPRPADVLFLGDSVSLDLVESVWRDRYCAPLMESLEAAGHSTLLMQPKAIQRLPRGQKTFSANWVDRWGRLLARLYRSKDTQFPDYEKFSQFLAERNIGIQAFQIDAMKSSGARVAAMARIFDLLLSVIRPKIGFVVSYYHDIGYAFVLACRRKEILSVDLQHGGQDGTHEAYNRWQAIPQQGYPILPAVFWTWSARDSSQINDWTKEIEPSWHRSVNGGHPQLIPWLDNNSPESRIYDKIIASEKNKSSATFDILVALQDVEKYADIWNTLADFITASPPHWRWWLRRHPAPIYNSGSSLKKILSLKRPNVFIEQASILPLPSLLRNVDAVMTSMSSTAFEASNFNHKTIFLTDDARNMWPYLLESGEALVITEMQSLKAHLLQIENLQKERRYDHSIPSLQNTIETLFSLAREYKNHISNQHVGSTNVKE